MSFTSYMCLTQCIDLFLAFILTGFILDDEVRAPIPQKQETLIEAGYEGYQMNNRQNYRKARIRTVFDGFRNFGNEASSKYSSICNKTITTGSYERGIQLHSSISMKLRFLGRAAISNKPREETYIRGAI